MRPLLQRHDLDQQEELVSSIRIAGIPVQKPEYLPENWRLFACADAAENGLVIEESKEGISVSLEELSAEHAELDVYHLADGSWVFQSPSRLPPAQVWLSPDGMIIRYHLPPWKDPAQQQIKLNHLLRTAFECRFCHEGIVSLHAACVENGQCAVAFTGKSGMGKSTRAKVWADALGFKWISGDRPAVRLEKDGSTACGVPWDGKEQIFCNVERPLKAIMDVRRSPKNCVRKLTDEQARRVLVRQVFIPMWDTDAAVMALVNLRILIEKTPVYRVFCGPGEDDAREIYDILFRHPEKIGEEEEDMKIRDGFVLRNVVDEYIVMPTGENIAEFAGSVVLNEVSAFVFEQMKNPMSREDLLAAVLEEFEVDEETAKADLDELLGEFRRLKLIED